MSEMQEAGRSSWKRFLDREVFEHCYGFWAHVERLAILALVPVMAVVILIFVVAVGGHIGDAVGLWEFNTSGGEECFRAGERIICN